MRTLTQRIADLLIAWRVPKAQAQKYKLEQAIDAAMGTVEVTPSSDTGGKKAAPTATGCF